MEVGDIYNNGYYDIVIVKLSNGQTRNDVRGVIIKNGNSPTPFRLGGVGRGWTSTELTLVENVGGFKRYVADHAMKLFNKASKFRPTITYIK